MTIQSGDSEVNRLESGGDNKREVKGEEVQRRKRMRAKRAKMSDYLGRCTWSVKKNERTGEPGSVEDMRRNRRTI